MEVRLGGVAALCLAGLIGSPVGIARSRGLPHQESSPVFSVRSELVVLHVLVTDRRGTYVSGLASPDFTVFEDGQRQTVQLFARQDAPVDVGLLVDGSGSMLTARDRVAAAAGTFTETSNPNDEIFALVFNEYVRPALPPDAPFTSDPETIRGALATAIRARGRTALYDAVAAGLEYLEKGSHLRKVLVVVADGGDNASRGTFEDVLRKTQVSNTVIYTIALVDPLDRDANPGRLGRLADASGGEAFRPRDVSEVEEVLGRIARDIRNSYTLGYVSSNTVRDERFRRVRVTANTPGRRGVLVRTRQGYVVEGR